MESLDDELLNMQTQAVGYRDPSEDENDMFQAETQAATTVGECGQ